MRFESVGYLIIKRRQEGETNENLLLIKVLTNSLPSPSVEPDIIAIFFVVKFIDLR